MLSSQNGQDLQKAQAFRSIHKTNKLINSFTNLEMNKETLKGKHEKLVITIVAEGVQ